MRHLIICLDGTSNRPEDERVSNIVKIATAAKQETAGGIPQFVYYQRGVGSAYAVDRVLGGATGAGVRAAVVSAYMFLVDNFKEGDRIFVFGFSRGAYAARLLCGLVDHSGVVRVDQFDHFKEAIENFFELRKNHDSTSEKIKAFRANHSYSGGNIDYVGVFDTVTGWLSPSWLSGAPSGKKNYFLGASIGHGRHALSIDERRIAFVPTVWRKRPEQPPDQIIEQVWFPGVHSDVGGSSPATSLGTDTLDWIVAGAESHGMEFDHQLLMPADGVARETRVFRWWRPDASTKNNLKRVRGQLLWSAMGVIVRPFALFSEPSLALRISRLLSIPNTAGLKVSKTAIDLVGESPDGYQPGNLLALLEPTGDCQLPVEALDLSVQSEASSPNVTVQLH